MFCCTRIGRVFIIMCARAAARFVCCMSTLRYAAWILPSVLCTYNIQKEEEGGGGKSRTIMGMWFVSFKPMLETSECCCVCMNFTCTPKRKKKYKWIETSFLFSNVKYQRREKEGKKLNSFNFSPMICGVLTFRLAIKPTLLSFSGVCVFEHSTRIGKCHNRKHIQYISFHSFFKLFLFLSIFIGDWLVCVCIWLSMQFAFITQFIFNPLRH